MIVELTIGLAELAGIIGSLVLGAWVLAARLGRIGERLAAIEATCKARGECRDEN